MRRASTHIIKKLKTELVQKKKMLPWHIEKGGVEAVNICQLVFFSLEGLQIFNLSESTRQ